MCGRGHSLLLLCLVEYEFVVAGASVHKKLTDAHMVNLFEPNKEIYLVLGSAKMPEESVSVGGELILVVRLGSKSEDCSDICSDTEQGITLKFAINPLTCIFLAHLPYVSHVRSDSGLRLNSRSISHIRRGGFDCGPRARF